MYVMNGYLNSIVINDLSTPGLQIKTYVFIYCILNDMYFTTFIKELFNTAFVELLVNIVLPVS